MRRHRSVRCLPGSVAASLFVVALLLVGSVGLSAVNPPLIISEFRLRGPSGANDEFVEIYNNSDSAHTVATSDGSSGYALVASDGTARFIIPNGVVIPARGHYLGANTIAYSIGSYPAGNGTTATGNAVYALDIPDNAGIALFNTSNPVNFTLANRMDAVGSTAEANTLYKEGTGYPALTPFSIDYSFYRTLCPIANACSGQPQDTGDNATDFLFVDTNGVSAGAGQRLGTGGPENLSGPVRLIATVTPAIAVSLVDTGVGPFTQPNFVRDFTSVPASNSTFGTVTIRRTVTNNSAGNITRLRFRVIDINTFPSPTFVADLRPRTSAGAIVGLSDGGTATVQATTLEQPPSQPNGGGFNSTFSAGTVTSGTPLAPGASVNVEFLLGIQQTGSFRFAVILETLPAASSTVLSVLSDTDKPDAPASPVAIAGDAQATVSFTALGSNGKAAPTGYTVVSDPLGGVDTNAGTTGLTHVVSGLINGAAYTFTVKAANVSGSGPGSTPSNSVTSDDLLLAGITGIKAAHVMELRPRIDDLRTRFGLLAYSWTDPNLSAGVTGIQAVHLTDLRTGLSGAYAVAGRTPVPTYTDPAPSVGTTTIKQAHFAELRAALAPKISSVTVAPGAGPLGGYLGLSGFGIPPIAGVGDETITNFTVPAFKWAGETWTKLGVVSNGYVIVGGGTSADVTPSTTVLPHALAPHNIIAPFWTNLNPGAGGAVRAALLTSGSNGWIVVDWAGVPNASSAAAVNTFEVWIWAATGANAAGSEGITFSYDTITSGNPSGLTVGAQDVSGSVGTTFFSNGTGSLPLSHTDLVTGTVQTFTNPATILMPATGTIGPGAPYPSTIDVAGVPGSIGKLTVTINDFRHHFPDDIDMLLVSPTGQKMIIWSDVGGTTSTCGATCDNLSNAGTTGVSITLDDAAVSILPDTGPLVSGTFRPSNVNSGEVFPAPAPAAPYASPAPDGVATLASTFNGIAANGTWSLYVIDDASSDAGRVQLGWSLNITASTTPPAAPTRPLSLVR